MIRASVGVAALTIIVLVPLAAFVVTLLSVGPHVRRNVTLIAAGVVGLLAAAIWGLGAF